MNLYQIDAAYRSFPPFAEWAGLDIDHDRWSRSAAGLPDSRSLPRHQLARAHSIAMRAAAVDTGAIEGLYDVDRGFTMTIALQTAAWESVLDARGEKVRSLIESQMHAYEYVMDLATGREPVSEMWIRALHERICESQDTYPVLTEVGWQNHPLPKGQYKSMPNHVRLQDGSYHAYAPVDLVAAEMHRLVEEMRSEAFQDAHPVLQSAYAHYALVCIHPFADGNGRVARALASVFTYRSHSVPLLMLVEHKPEYLAALRRADEGEPQAFIDFVFERTVDAMLLVSQTLQAASAPDPDEEAANLRAVFLTKGGYSHAQVDQAGETLLSLLEAEYKKQSESLNTAGQVLFLVKTAVPSNEAEKEPPRDHYRFTSGRRMLIARASTPALVVVSRIVASEVPANSAVEDVVYLNVGGAADPFIARLPELIPASSSLLQIRLAVFVRGLIGEMLGQLRETATEEMRRTLS
ncbi:MAG TPA: Fic family protein [Longimicrobium sp.]|nr:Fic family protein [Longimicrobium sp.]